MPNPPDAIFLHGTVLTLDAARPAAQALAVQGERLLAVGTDAEIATLAGARTHRVDLRGLCVVPGFHDAHTHQLGTGANQLALDLAGTQTIEEFQRRIRDYAAGLAPGAWLLGGQWDQTQWPGQRFPTRADLDACTGDHPAYLVRLDIHAAVANTLALAAARVTAVTEAPPGGVIGHDVQGQPDGRLFEDARQLVTRVIPPPSPQQRRRALELSMREALCHGVTSLQDYSDWDSFLLYEQMQREGALHVRVNEWLDFRQPLPVLCEQRAHHPAPDPWLRTGMLKAFLDGSLGSRTASLRAPYADDPATRGRPQYDTGELTALALARAQAGFQLGFHAIGDAAAAQALDVFQAVHAATAPAHPAPRHRIEHLQLLVPADLVRMRELGVIASVQPSHLLDDLRWAAARLGPARLPDSYRWQSLLRAGIPLALGSDTPVQPVNPMLGLFAALARGRGGALPYPPAAEALKLSQALQAYTLGGAFAEFSEADKGSLAPGKLADFAVLSRDPRPATPEEILDTKVRLTVVGGRVRWVDSLDLPAGLEYQ